MPKVLSDKHKSTVSSFVHEILPPRQEHSMPSIRLEQSSHRQSSLKARWNIWKFSSGVFSSLTQNLIAGRWSRDRSIFTSTKSSYSDSQNHAHTRSQCSKATDAPIAGKLRPSSTYSNRSGRSATYSASEKIMTHYFWDKPYRFFLLIGFRYAINLKKIKVLITVSVSAILIVSVHYGSNIWTKSIFQSVNKMFRFWFKCKIFQISIYNIRKNFDLI